MRTRTVVSIVGLVVSAMLAVVLLLVSGSTPGEYHAGGTLLCYDCHTMHFSQSHNWDGTTPVSTTVKSGGNWLSTNGPNAYLLKDTATNLCLACHNGQTYAPDVYGVSTNTQRQGREAGALNDRTTLDGYQIWMGHTLGDTTNPPPGNNETAVGAPSGWYTSTIGTAGLQCISCHGVHGQADAYRNLGPVALGTDANANNFRPTYAINSTFTTGTACNNATGARATACDVWINLASYVAGSGTPNFDYYDQSKISFSRNDATTGTTKTSNRLDTFCGACHGNFHGSVADTAIGGTAMGTSGNGFLRHPTAQVTIGGTGALVGEHSSLTLFAGNTTKVKVYTTDFASYSNATPGCVSCHKAHGNKNPFGLVFLSGNASGTPNEEGGYASGQTPDVPTGYRNLCGQCHA